MFADYKFAEKSAVALSATADFFVYFVNFVLINPAEAFLDAK